MNVDEAITRAFNGAEAKDIKNGKHEFHIKAIAVTRSGSRETARGQISHKLRFREDDQVKYTIVKDREVVTALDLSIDRGGLGRLIGTPLSKAVGFEIPTAVFDKVGKLVDGTWEGSARDIVQRIAVRL